MMIKKTKGKGFEIISERSLLLFFSFDWDIFVLHFLEIYVVIVKEKMTVKKSVLISVKSD